jgi:hypothetical protein
MRGRECVHSKKTNKYPSVIAACLSLNMWIIILILSESLFGPFGPFSLLKNLVYIFTTHFSATNGKTSNFHLHGSAKGKSVPNQEYNCTAGLCPNPLMFEIRCALGSCLSWEKGVRTNPRGDASWHPPNQTGWMHFWTYVLVDKTHVPGDDGHSCLRLFQRTQLK